MKHFAFLLFFALMIAGCQNEQKQFCDSAATTLCERCDTCGGNYAQCGLNRVTNRSECISTLKTVCAAYDAKYTKERARLCLESLNSLSCDQLKSEGKSEFCEALF